MTRTLDLATFTVPTGWRVEERGTGDGRHAVMWTASATASCAITVYASRRSWPAANWPRALLPNGRGLHSRRSHQDQRPAPQERDRRSSRGHRRDGLERAGPTDGGVAHRGRRRQPRRADHAAHAQLRDAGLVSRGVRPVPPRAWPCAGWTRRPRPSLAQSDRSSLSPSSRANGDATTASTLATSIAQTGDYAGTDSLHFTEKWTDQRERRHHPRFLRHPQRTAHRGERAPVSCRCSPMESWSSANRTSSASSCVGGSRRRHMTVMTLNGPWYDDIPPDDRREPSAVGANLDQRWVRLRV